MPKGMPKHPSVKKAILHRLKIARGHLDRVIAMVDEDAYCIDVIGQSIAIQAALKSTDEVIMKNHLETCVAEEIKKGNTSEVIAEVMEIIEKK